MYCERHEASEQERKSFSHCSSLGARKPRRPPSKPLEYHGRAVLVDVRQVEHARARESEQERSSDVVGGRRRAAEAPSEATQTQLGSEEALGSAATRAALATRRADAVGLVLGAGADGRSSIDLGGLGSWLLLLLRRLAGDAVRDAAESCVEGARVREWVEVQTGREAGRHGRTSKDQSQYHGVGLGGLGAWGLGGLGAWGLGGLGDGDGSRATTKDERASVSLHTHAQARAP